MSQTSTQPFLTEPAPRGDSPGGGIEQGFHPVASRVGFDPDVAFSRNIGWFTREELQRLRRKRVAIAGLGGVGGAHLATLARLGVQRFIVAEFDNFELVNFNRQVGADLDTIGQPKISVMTDAVRRINPLAEVTAFDEGVHPHNVDQFLDGADVYLDSLDFFAVGARRLLFHACEARGIPAVTAAPLGMGAALLNFLPGRMSFEDYFGLEGYNEAEQLLRFLIGLAPARLHMPYLVDPSAVDLPNHRGPSTILAVNLCAGLAGAHVAKILLGRGDVPAAPTGVHFDAYRNRMVRTRRPGGWRHPLQRLAYAVARRSPVFREMQSVIAADDPVAASPDAEPDASGEQLAEASSTAGRAAMRSGDPHDISAEAILERARWAPSGDNTQPWRFEIHDPTRFTLHGHDTRDHCVYDLDGRASQLAVGALIETADLAARQAGARIDFDTDLTDERRPTIHATLRRDPGVYANPLADVIETRSTQRRPLSSKPMLPRDREVLETSFSQPGYAIRWFATRAERRRMASLLWDNAGIRLTIPEAYQVHCDAIEWDATTSDDRIPDSAVGLDPMGLKMMRWAMASWERVRFMNKWMGGTLLPRFQLDYLTAMGCAAHAVVMAPRTPDSVADWLDAGRQMQRLWLAAASVGMQLQPEMTPLIFARYIRQGLPFTTEPHGRAAAEKLADRLEAMLGGPDDAPRAVFLCRVGYGAAPTSRSLRKRLDQLLRQDRDAQAADAPSDTAA